MLIDYWPFLLVCLFGAAFIAALVLYSRRAKSVGELKFKRHYLLIWPLLIDRLQKDPKRAGVLFTKRELVGWGLVLTVVVVAIIINPGKRS